MSVDSLPPLEDPSEFESLCLDLWREIWGPTSDAQKNGRSGQPQAGVDVYGRDGGSWVGIQCKQKSAQVDSKLTVDELEKEVGKARGFSPSLSFFIVATTGPRAQAVQERARQISDGGFRVAVWSWDEIWEAIKARPELLRRLGPKYWPSIWRTQSAPQEVSSTTVSAGPGGAAIGGSVLGNVTIFNTLSAEPKVVEIQRKAAPTRLTHVVEELIGREKECAALDVAWANPNVRVVTLVAWGGVGKTSLVGKWAAEKDLGGSDYFDWSFYSQGTREEGSASGEPFVNAALRFFGGEEGERIAASSMSGWEKGARLAELVARRKALLVLDGLEPLQYPSAGPKATAGQVKDPGVAALLRGLAGNNPGLCVVTTRESVEDLARFRTTTAPEWKLERLSTAAGVDLLEKLGVKGNRKEKEAVVEKVQGHALTLSLLGTFLRDGFEGDIRRVDLVDLHEADQEEQGGHAFRVIAAYERWFVNEGKDEASRELAALRLLGLFDRPADKKCLAALRKEPAIQGLTGPLVGMSETKWNLTVSRLAARGLASSEGETLDAHPLVRDYFAVQLKTKNPESWRSAHGRLFEHLRDSTPHQPDTLEGLQPLYQAVAHGCHAGRQQEACDGIYLDRISRGAEAFVVKKLGAFGADLGAVACFFDPPWGRVSPALSEAAQAWLLSAAAFRLRALGRLTEALEPLRAGLEMGIAQENWKSAAIRASNLSELELTLGEVARSAEDAARSVTFADRSGDAFERMADRTVRADALHQLGRVGESRTLFAEAEGMQAEFQPEYPRLSSLGGFRYCDLLLGAAERAAGRKGGAEAAGAEHFEAIREVEERAAYAIEFARNNHWLLDIALDQLTLGRATLYRSSLEGSDPAAAKAEIELALDGLRRAGALEFIAGGLLTRSWLHFELGNPEATRADLAEAQEIAERGPMPLFLADIALYRGRMFGDREALAEARRLIEKHGYGRRLGELEDAEAALAS